MLDECFRIAMAYLELGERKWANQANVDLEIVCMTFPASIFLLAVHKRNESTHKYALTCCCVAHAANENSPKYIPENYMQQL